MNFEPKNDEKNQQINILLASDGVGKLNEQVMMTIWSLVPDWAKFVIAHSRYQLLNILDPENKNQFDLILCDTDLAWNNSGFTDAEKGALSNDIIRNLWKKHGLWEGKELDFFSNRPVFWLHSLVNSHVLWLSCKTKGALVKEFQIWLSDNNLVLYFQNNWMRGIKRYIKDKEIPDFKNKIWKLLQSRSV